MKINRFFLLLSVLMLLPSALLSAMARDESPAPEDVNYKFYVVTHGGPSDPFWRTVMKGAEDAGELYNCDVSYIGPEKYSVQNLVDMVETAIAGQPDGLVVTVTDVKALDKPLKDAIAAGIPVIAINVPDTRDSEDKIPYLAYVGVDDYLVGALAGKRMLEEFGADKPEKGVILVHQVGHTGLEARAKGISDVFTEHKIPVDKIAGTADASENYQILDAYLSMNSGTDAFFALGPLGADPFLNLIEDRNLKGKVKLGSVDLSVNTTRAISEGTMVFTIEQQQYLQGYLPIGFLVLYNKFGLIPQGDIFTGPAIVDRNNVEMVSDMVLERFR